MKQAPIGHTITDHNRTVHIGLDALADTRMLIQGNSGAGKSWLMRVMAERIKGVQILILDPEGEFGTLRKVRDEFLLVGGDGAEIHADTKSAALLARKLTELNVSAILDLYELKLAERRHFVKLFLDSLMNIPKPLWHTMFVFLDEAHIFCPERSAGESEATESVITMMSQGRKRGVCGIPATQRLSKLHKDAAAECNNVVIGRTWLDVDQIRAGDLLGMVKADRVALRDLDKGQFWAFGPAFDVNGVFQFESAPVESPHPKAGERYKMVMPAPSAAISHILKELADLPTKAAEEAKTVEQLRAEIRTLKAQIRRPAPQPEVSAATIAKYVEAERKRVNNAWVKGNVALAKELMTFNVKIQELAERSGRIKMMVFPPEEAETIPKTFLLNEQHELPRHEKPRTHVPLPVSPRKFEDGALPGPEQRILDAVMWLHSIGVEEADQRAVAFLANYSPGGGAFNNPKAKLKGKGLIDYLPSGRLRATEEGRTRANAPEIPLSTEELHAKVMAQLGGPEQRILKPLLDCYPRSMPVTELAEKANYEMGGAFNNPKGRLRTLGLIDYPERGYCKAESILFID